MDRSDVKINALYLFYLGFPLADTAITRKPVLTEAPAKLGYRLSFRIVNENLTNPDSQSPEYKAAVESISNKVRSCSSNTIMTALVNFCSNCCRFVS